MNIPQKKIAVRLIFICSFLCLLIMYDVNTSIFSKFKSYMGLQLAKHPLSIEEESLSELIKAGFICRPLSVNVTSSNGKDQTVPPDVKIDSNPENVTRFLVPNVVHYVWPGHDLNFTFIHYLSFLSAHRYIEPSYIFVHGEEQPRGHWWNRTVAEVRNVVHVFHVLNMTSPSGKRFKHMAHVSDVLRTQIIYKFGGIYLDSDIIVLRSFDPLRQYQTVLGREAPDCVCNGIMISTRGTPFIRMLLEQYDSYSGEDEIWAYRSVLVPHALSQIFKSYLHIEEESLQRPNWMELDKIYDKAIDWSNNYAIHLWVRMQKLRNVTSLPQSVDDIDCSNTTIGQIGRHVYYGSQRIVSPKCKKQL